MSEQELNNQDQPASQEAMPHPESSETVSESSAPISQQESPAESTEQTSQSVESSETTAQSTHEHTESQSSETQKSVVIEQEPSAAEKRKEEREKRKKLEEEMLATLEKVFNEGGTIEALVVERIKGGLRLNYNGMRLFMPASHFGLKKTAQEQDLNDAVGKTFTVNISEIQKDDQGRATIVASRKKLLSSAFFNTVKEGDIVEGTVSSITAFGVFVDVQGVEGMVHVSRMASFRVGDPASLFKKGDTVKATITSIDKDKFRMGLSTKDFVASPWDTVETTYPTGAVVKGTVKRFTEFGTYIELQPGIEGLLRNGDLAWGKRNVSAQDIMKEGQTIEVAVLNASAEKKRVGLSIKHLSPNPWKTIAETLPAGANATVTIKQIHEKGYLVDVNADFDGFIPKGRVKPVPGKSSFAIGDKVDAVVIDSNGETESLILAPSYTQEELDALPQRAPRGPRESRERDEPSGPMPEAPSITLLDMLSEEQRSGLTNNN
ncbi:MAG: S1 RNA-binding domain-containing protein [bacterium]